jgi:hypothetical protein
MSSIMSRLPYMPRFLFEVLLNMLELLLMHVVNF